MFRSHARRFVVPTAALLLSALLVLPAVGDTEPPHAPPKTPPLLFAPPLFATAGQARDVSAIVTGVPDAVRLVVGDRSFEMRPSGDSTFSGTIPSELVTSELTYAVVASYGDVVNTSEPARLVALEEVRGSRPRLLSTAGTPIVDIGLGSRSDELGASDAREGARQLPAAFVTDAAGRTITVLDTLKSRIVHATKDGVQEATKLANGTTTATDIVRGRKGSLLVLDQARDEVVDVTSTKQRAAGGVGTRKHDRGARLAFDAASDTIFVSDATQGRFLPLLKQGRKTTSRERSDQAADGAPTSIGALAAQVDGSSVVFGLDANRNSGYRVTFEEPVLDATEVVVDRAGVIFGLVGVVKGSGAGMYLVSVDPVTGASTATPVPVSLPGDVTRRLAPADDGVVLMNGTDRALSFVRFTKGDGR